MRRHAHKNPSFQPRLDSALQAGAINRDFEPLAQSSEIPALLPFEIAQSDGSIQRITSLTAHFTSVHDEIIAGIEIELLVPMDNNK
jgi:hypothetical protein